MSKQLVIVLSGRKQSGKSTSANHITAYYLNALNDTDVTFGVDNETGHLMSYGRCQWSLMENCADYLLKRGIKQYSFADPLKEFCVNVLGAKYEQCYGTDAQKDSIIPHLLWENVPKDTRPYRDNIVGYNPERIAAHIEMTGTVDLNTIKREYKSGPMTGRELMQWFGTDLCRRLYGDVWARGTYTKIKNEGYPLAIVTDGRFPNEINIGAEVNAKTIRLGRVVREDNHPSEVALDNYPIEKYSAYVDNRLMSIDQQGEAIEAIVAPWFAEAGLINEQRRTSLKVSTTETCGCGGTGACSSNAE